MTYTLEVEREQEVRPQLQMYRGQWRHTPWRWRGRARGQITVVIVKGAVTTYFLEVEREGNRSDHGWDCKWDREHILPGSGERARVRP
jgi:hypothetical protein